MTSVSLAQRIDQLLPQTQCTKCGYAGCAPYAEAIAAGAAPNRCPPGGRAGVVRIVALLRDAAPARQAELTDITEVDAECGVERPRPVAFIDESLCIGCTLCIQACPVDAIAGAAKQMHTVLADLCTGCDLCVAPCPVDCIGMLPITGTATGWQAWSQPQADAARQRYLQRGDRLEAERAATRQRALARAAALQPQAATPVPSEQQQEQAKKHAIIAAAIERTRLKRAALAAQQSPPAQPAGATVPTRDAGEPDR